jgi:hypothetical protein
MKLLVFLLTLTLQSATQQEPSLMTQGFINGRAWMNFDEAAKIAYLFGFMDGANALQVQLDDQPELKSLDGVIWKAKEPLLTKAATGEVAQQIDTLYRDSANLRIPVVFAYKYAVKRINGGTPAELEEYLTNVRRNVSRQ